MVEKTGHCRLEWTDGPRVSRCPPQGSERGEGGDGQLLGGRLGPRSSRRVKQKGMKRKRISPSYASLSFPSCPCSWPEGGRSHGLHPGAMLLNHYCDRNLKCTKYINYNRITIIVFAEAGSGTINLSQFK